MADSDKTGPEHTFLTPQQLAQRWSVKAATLANQRYRGEGVPFVKLNTSIRYRLSDVMAMELDSVRGLSWARLANAIGGYPALADSQRRKLLTYLRRQLDRQS